MNHNEVLAKQELLLNGESVDIEAARPPRTHSDSTFLARSSARFRTIRQAT
jgi:hypothetical protein